MRWLILITILLLFATPVIGEKQGTMKLLAVSQSANSMSGTVATLSLELRPGDGRVFLETFPLTKGDTQISMRFAKQIACNYIDSDCSKYDFIYTIKSNSGIIGGPSAGAAATLLTLAVLEDKEVPTTISATGTINSGGLIGGVAGIKEKIEAAAQSGITTVLIPYGRRNISINNMTVDLVALGGELNVSVIEISSIDEAIPFVLGHSYVKEKQEFLLDPEYTQVMSKLAKQLCERSKSLNKEIKKIPTNHNDSTYSLINQSNKMYESAEKALLKDHHYSAASYCFRTNVDRQIILLTKENLTQQEVITKAAKLKKGISALEKFIHTKEINTITDLQTYMVVNERLVAANEFLQKLENKTQDPTESAFLLGFANERLYSAKAWSTFFNTPGKKYVIDSKVLKKSCEAKIRESEERLQYVLLYIPNALPSVREGIEDAYRYMYDEEYELCLFEASRAKSEASMVAGVLGAEQRHLQGIIDKKLEMTNHIIARAQSKGMFPIVGYSYYEYAESLSKTDVNSALLYSEYALELSNFDLYFQEVENEDEKQYPVFSIIIGLLIGALIIGILIRR